MIPKLKASVLSAAAVGLLVSTAPSHATAADTQPVLLAQAEASTDLAAFLPEGVTLETATAAELDAALTAAIAGLTDEEVVALVEQWSASAPTRAAQIAQSAALARPDATTAIAVAAAQGAPGYAAAIVAAVVVVAPSDADAVVASVSAAVPGVEVADLQQAADQGLAGVGGFAETSDDPGQALPFFDEQAAQFDAPPEDEREPVSPTQL